MKKYMTLQSKSGAKWSCDFETTSKRSATNRAKEIEKNGGSAEVWIVEEKGGFQTQYKIR